MTEPHARVSRLRYLQRPGGRIAYDVAGGGPLVVCSPGMGDLRSVYRFLAPALVDAGYRVALVDLRGHGDSDATFDSYGDAETSDDLLALVSELGGPAVIVGNSMSAGAAVLAALAAPELISGLVLVGPFVRDARHAALTRSLFGAMLLPPWGTAVWNAYYPAFYPGVRPADLDDHRRRISASLRRPGRRRAFRLTAKTSHAAAAERLGDVKAPTLVIMGTADPDFSDPPSEADWIASRLNAEVVMVPGAGHYPQAQNPEIVVPAIIGWLGGLPGLRWASS